MMFRVAIVSCVLAGFFSCTKSAPEAPLPKRVDRPAKLQPKQTSTKENPTFQLGMVPVTLDQNQLRATFAVNTASLTYKMKYLGAVREGPIDFQGSKTTLKIQDLPVGQTGTMRFELYDAGKLTIFGQNAAVTLKKGLNTQTITLKKVNDQSQGALSIGIRLEDIRQYLENEPENNIEETDPDYSNLSQTGQKAMSVLKKHCSECHHAGRPIQLVSLPMSAPFSQEQAAIYQKVIDSISGAGKSMPPAPRTKLTASEIEAVKAWQSNLGQ